MYIKYSIIMIHYRVSAGLECRERKRERERGRERWREREREREEKAVRLVDGGTCRGGKHILGSHSPVRKWRETRE